jgi:hypothetical protein
LAAKKPIEPWRHSANCTVCHHPQRAEIEHLFLEWQSPSKIAKQYRLGSRQAIFRHARAMDLFSERTDNARGTLRAVIERGMSGGMKVTGDVVVRAAVALSKMDEQGRTVDRFEQINSHAKFLNDARWTQGQMLRYAETGELPEWLVESDEGEERAPASLGASLSDTRSIRGTGSRKRN